MIDVIGISFSVSSNSAIEVALLISRPSAFLKMKSPKPRLLIIKSWSLCRRFFDSLCRKVTPNILAFSLFFKSVDCKIIGISLLSSLILDISFIPASESIFLLWRNPTSEIIDIMYSLYFS